MDSVETDKRLDDLSKKIDEILRLQSSSMEFHWVEELRPYPYVDTITFRHDDYENMKQRIVNLVKGEISNV